MDDLAVRRGNLEHGQVLCHRPAGDSDLVNVQQSLIVEHLHDHRDATDAVDVNHVVLPVRLGVG